MGLNTPDVRKLRLTASRKEGTRTCGKSRCTERIMKMFFYVCHGQSIWYCLVKVKLDLKNLAYLRLDVGMEMGINCYKQSVTGEVCEYNV